MSPLRTLLASRFASDERGVTLTELLVAMTILLVVLGGTLTIIQITVQTEPKVREQAGDIQEGRALMGRVVRELRQAYAVHTASAQVLDFSTYVRSSSCGGSGTLSPSQAAIACRVTYSCTAGTCTRTEVNPTTGLGGAPTQLVKGLREGDVFDYDGDPTRPSYVGITLSYPDDEGDETITLTDGVAPRNVAVDG